MSSGFVSAGTIDKPTERDDAWRAAQQELEENRRRKEEASAQHDGKSLYEVLQANKAAKQEAFEEANRLKNQFRGLDDDEAEFLDSVLEQSRKKEAEIRKDTLEQLEVFRREKEEAERKALEQSAGSPEAEEGVIQWAAPVGRKRKKEGGLLPGVKLRKASSNADAGEAKKAVESATKTEGIDKIGTVTASASKQQPKKNVERADTKAAKKVSKGASPPAKPSKPVFLNLGYGSSDEDD